MKYTYIVDYGELLTECRELACVEQALAYGQDLFDHSNAAFVTVVDESGKAIKEFE